MAEIIGILNEKGGVGKTTTATTMAYLLAQQGRKVALIDFDGQGHSSIICGVSNPNKLEITVATLMNCMASEQELPPLESYVIRSKNGIDLIPANSQLFVLERNLCSIDFREYKLREYIDTIRDGYDFIIIDCMPQIGTPMVNVLMASDRIIIPTQSEILSAQGLSELLLHYHRIKRGGNEKLTVDGILITMDSPRTNLSAQVSDMIVDSFGESIPVFKTRIPRSIKVGEACLYQQTICEYMPENPAAVAYENFVKEWLENGKACADPTA